MRQFIKNQPAAQLMKQLTDKVALIRDEMSPHIIDLSEKEKGERSMAEGREGIVRLLSKIALAHNESLGKKDNAQELDKWKDPEKVLSGKLTEFLEKSKDVDFTAQTKDVNNRKKFVNAAYEGKSDIWKFCYRMGKTPTVTARAFAQQWLAEMK